MAAQIGGFAQRLTDAVYSYGSEIPGCSAWIPGHGPKLKALVFDAGALVQVDQLKQLREFFQPLLRNLESCAHVVILGRAPQGEGFSRSLAKELRNGGTLQLLYIDDEAQDQLEGALRFFLSPKSAYISGQVLHLGACNSRVHDWSRPLAGRKALVTGAARGIGAAIAETLARDGSEIILLDVPQAKTDLDALAARLGACTTPVSPATRPWRT